jgi:hypothetical protein
MFMSSFRARWNVMAAPLLAAFFLFWFILRPVKNAVHWLVQDHPRLSPLAATAFEGGLLAIVAPLTLAALIYVELNGLAKIFAQVRSFWMKGARLGIACLLLLSPGIILWQAFEYSTALGVFDFNSRYGFLLRFLAWAVYLVAAPFWALPFLGFFQAARSGSVEASREEDRVREGLVRGVSG